MPARFNLSALSRRRWAKFTLVSLTAIAVITLVTFTARAWRDKTSPVARQDAGAAQPTPVANAIGYVRRARLLPQLREALNALGDRLEKPGRERLTMIGTLRRRNNPQAIPFRLFLELPRRMRLEEQGAQPRVIGFDGLNGWVLGAAPSAADQEAIETLVFDSADHFFLGQTQGFAKRALGQRFRLDDGASAGYDGPFYDIYQVADRIAIGSATREQPKLFYFNSDTQLLERVRYQIIRNGAAVDVEARVSGYQRTDSQRLPNTIIRQENGSQTLLLTINSIVVGPRLDDGIFRNPQGN